MNEIIDAANAIWPYLKPITITLGGLAGLAGISLPFLPRKKTGQVGYALASVAETLFTKFPWLKKFDRYALTIDDLVSGYNRRRKETKNA